MPMPSAIPEGISKMCNDKKASKPLIEKRRRARINSSLSELKLIVVGTENSRMTTTARPPKLEKADILEMTVAFIKNKLATKQLSSSRDLNEYTMGYDFCLKEVCQFLEEEGNYNIKSRLLMHLQSIQQGSNNPDHSNAAAEDSMSCSSNSRSDTPSTVSTENCQMEYSSSSPFTDHEQEVPSTSSRTFPTNRNELGNCVEHPISSPDSRQDNVSGCFCGPLNLATTPKKIQKDDNANPTQQWSAVYYNPPDKVVTCSCRQEHHLMQRREYPAQVAYACSSNCVWRPW